MATAPTLTPKMLANELGTDPRTARKFLRSITPRDEQPGKGGRWEIKGDRRSITALGKQFAKWNADQEAAKAARAQSKAEEAKAVADSIDEVDADGTDEVDDEVMDLDDLEGPTDDDLEALDAE